MTRDPENLADLKRSMGLEQLRDLADREGLRHRGSGRNRSECPGCRNGDPRGASIGENDGVGVWNCHRDERHRGTAIDFLAHSRSISVAEAIQVLEDGVGSCAPVPDRPRYQRPPPAPPPGAEVAALWAVCKPLGLDGEISDAWTARRIDVGHVEDRDLARALPRGAAVPGWATFAGQVWSAGRHRLIVPMYDAAGRLRSLHARAVSTNKGVPKGLSPAGHAVGGLVMADPLSRLLLAGAACGDGEPASETVRRCGLVICEGVPDFLTWGTRWGDAAESAPAVLGIISGSWTEQIAALIPARTVVYLRTHADPAGAKYAAQIASTLEQRCNVRLPGNDGGVA
jgi:hypothetical protein